MSEYAKATVSGMIALILWSTGVTFTRSVSEALGPLGGPALIYILTAIMLFAKNGLRPQGSVTLRYAVTCGLFLVAYNVCFSQAIGTAASRQQAVEASIIQYLWPCFILLFSPFVLHMKFNLLVLPGILVGFGGAAWCIAGDEWNLSGLVENICENPTPYAFALSAAAAWGMYSSFSRLYADGNGCNALFFLISGAVLWILHVLGGGSISGSGIRPFFEALAMGGMFSISYPLWDTGIRRGNMTLLAVCAYFIPVLSSLFAGVWLDVELAAGFWPGVGGVVAGSLLCWWASNQKVSGAGSRGVRWRLLFEAPRHSRETQPSSRAPFFGVKNEVIKKRLSDEG